MAHDGERSVIELFKHNFDSKSACENNDADGAGQRQNQELEAFLEEARQQGFEAGRAFGREEVEAESREANAKKLADVLARVEDQLLTLRHGDDALRQQTERDIIELFMGIAERVLPEVLERHGYALAIARLKTCLEQARTDPILSIRANPDILVYLEREAPDWLSAANRISQIEMIPDPSMDHAEVETRWRGGRLEYNLNEASAAVLTALHKAASEFTQAMEAVQ